MSTVSGSFSDTSSNEDGLYVYRSTATSPSFPSDYSRFETLAPNTTSFEDTNAPAGQTVHYAVTAYNGVGESSPETATIETIAAPTIETPYADSSSEIVVPWTKNDDSSDGGFDVERSTDGGASWSTIASGIPPSTTEYATGTPVPDTATYTYRIRRYADNASERSGTKDVYVDYQVTITGTNSPVAAGESLDVTVDVTNNGTIEGDQPVELTLTEQ